jgi:hypothetical protein
LKLFGNKETFAIEYRPDTVSEKYAYAFCHLYLGGKRIGNQEENCLLSTWYCYFKHQIHRIQRQEGQLRSPFFEGLSDQEIFDLIFEEYDNTTHCFDTEVVADLVRKHAIRIDETIDGYNIAVIEENGYLKFMWVSRGRYEPKEEVEKLHTIIISHWEFYQVAEDCLGFLKEEYHNHLEK